MINPSSNTKEEAKVVAINHKHSFTVHHEWGDSVKCGKCGYISHWNYVAAPVALLCDDKGNPK